MVTSAPFALTCQNNPVRHKSHKRRASRHDRNDQRRQVLPVGAGLARQPTPFGRRLVTFDHLSDNPPSLVTAIVIAAWCLRPRPTQARSACRVRGSGRTPLTAGSVRRGTRAVERAQACRLVLSPGGPSRPGWGRTRTGSPPPAACWRSSSRAPRGHSAGGSRGVVLALQAVPSRETRLEMRLVSRCCAGASSCARRTHEREKARQSR